MTIEFYEIIYVKKKQIEFVKINKMDNIFYNLIYLLMYITIINSLKSYNLYNIVLYNVLNLFNNFMRK